MKKFVLTSLGFIFFVCSLHGQSQKLESFIPKDFTLLDSVSDDINKDGKRDLIVILKNNYENLNTDTTRPLLLLFGEANQKYKLVARNDSVVLCMGCGGVHGDPYAGITIKNGYFSIEHYGGSSWRWTRIITFKYDVKSGQILLHRDAGESWHLSDPEKTTMHLYSKTDFGKLQFAKYSYEKGWRD